MDFRINLSGCLPDCCENVVNSLASVISPSVVTVNVNVNVNLYSASSQKAPLMRSMCRVLIKKTRLHCTTKTVNLHVRLARIVLVQVPCRWSSDSEGATAVRIELRVSCILVHTVVDPYSYSYS